MRYIFVINDTEKEFSKRIKAKKWPTYTNTVNARHLKKGDQIIFYKAGTGNHIFSGSANIDSVDVNEKGRGEVTLVKIEVWKNPVEITKIYDKLKIIKNPAYYGAYLAGGIKKLTESDFEFIVRNGKK